MNGNIPKMRLIILYFPVRCIINPAKREPQDIDMLFGNKCAPVINPSALHTCKETKNAAPALLALVSATVSNHMGKKYMTAKLQFATRKFWIPIKTGIFCRNNPGARTGSGATSNSNMTNMTKNATARDNGTMTAAELHYLFMSLGRRFFGIRRHVLRSLR